MPYPVCETGSSVSGCRADVAWAAMCWVLPGLVFGRCLRSTAKFFQFGAGFLLHQESGCIGFVLKTIEN